MKARKPSWLWLVLVNAAYALAAAAGWPYYLYLLATRSKYRHALRERWGFAPRFPPDNRRLWVHAISVGEVEAARTFIPALAAAYPDAEIVVSTTTLTGRQRAERLFPGRPIFYFPLDLLPCVWLALRRVKPTAVVQVESEWWPNFFFLARLRGIPVVCVNVRMTEHGHRGYMRIRGIARAVFNCASAIGVQTDLYRQRLVSLGTDPDRITVTGQMKHDGVEFADTVAGADDLRRDMGIEPDAPVLVAGSTAPGEESAILAAYAEARKVEPRLRLVIVPRRPENFGATAEAIGNAGYVVVCRSGGQAAPVDDLAPPPVILGDTMGELMKWYALADVVFVGRSLVPLGGSNPMEPGSLGKAILWGPHMFNFPVEATAFESAGAARRVSGPAELAATLVELLTRPERRRQMGLAARQCIRQMQGATDRTVGLVRKSLAEESG